MDYKEDLKINPEMLDVEWLNQPNKMIKYAEMLSKAQLQLDKQKEKLEVYEAELALSIRANPEEYGFNKATEGTVREAVVSDEERKKLRKELLVKRFRVDILRSAVNAFEHRKRALEHLVTLHGQQYFSSPKIPHNLTKLYQDNQERTERVTNKINKRKRRKDV